MSGARVLIVEDNPINLELAAYLLEAAGFVVEAATTAAEAIARARATPPALILMDVELPGMDGLAATRHLKADPATASIPVVALTASAMRGDEERCLEAGCEGYVAKPFDRRHFVDLVRRYCQGGARPPAPAPAQREEAGAPGPAAPRERHAPAPTPGREPGTAAPTPPRKEEQRA